MIRITNIPSHWTLGHFFAELRWPIKVCGKSPYVILLWIESKRKWRLLATSAEKENAVVPPYLWFQLSAVSGVYNHTNKKQNGVICISYSVIAVLVLFKPLLTVIMVPKCKMLLLFHLCAICTYTKIPWNRGFAAICTRGYGGDIEIKIVNSPSFYHTACKFDERGRIERHILNETQHHWISSQTQFDQVD